MLLNQNERKIINEFQLINGFGSMTVANGELRDVEVVALMRHERWWFMIHRDIREPQYYTISEVSSGVKLRDENYVEIEDALYFGIPFIYEKRFYFATKVLGFCVEFQRDLIKRNLGLQTLAIDTALWL